MGEEDLTRRDALKLALLALGAVAWRPFKPYENIAPPPFLGLVRITIDHVPVHREPAFRSPVEDYLGRDQVVRVLEKMISPEGPTYNPRWYRVPGGYLHTAYTQEVQVRLNPVATAVPEGGQLAEVTVPYTRCWKISPEGEYFPLYRLYYGSVYWVTGVRLGRYQEPLYEITDDLLKVPYYVYAPYLRLIRPEELTPLSPDVPPLEKWIEVDLRTQTLRAYEGQTIVLETKISSGIPSDKPTDNGIPTRTPSGRFGVFHKVPSRHMGNGDLTASLEAYELPGVPWVSFFVDTGVAFHGTYWHDNFGRPMSHGCVNMRNEDALWIFRWTMPAYEPMMPEAKGRGTLVWVHE